MIENNYGIREITIKPIARCFCPLGKDWYTNQFEIKIIPASIIPDYAELETWLDRNIRGKEMIIEEAVAKAKEYIKLNYRPEEVFIRSMVEDASAHSTVIVLA